MRVMVGNCHGGSFQGASCLGFCIVCYKQRTRARVDVYSLYSLFFSYFLSIEQFAILVDIKLLIIFWFTQ